MGKNVTKRVLEEVRFKNDIVDVIQSGLDLKRTGATYKALCPFHKEKTPSFHVNPQRQIFHCFGCGKGGDVFKFIMEYEGVDFIGAVKLLADRAGIKLELEDGDGHASDKDILFRINLEVCELYQKLLLEDDGAESARKYLAGRKLDRTAAARFRIGYAPDDWDYMVRWASESKYSMDLMERAGLVVRKTDEKGTRFYDRFRARVMFAILDEQGRVVGFSGRILNPDAREAKYVNTPETPLFHKARVLYGLHAARRKIVESREAVICEGQIDVIRCHLAGFETAVASQGTAFSEDHVRMIRRYADSVVIVFDSDSAGQNAAIRTAQQFVAAGVAVRVAALPRGQDPDSLILARGAEGFSAVLDGALSAVAFQASVLSSSENVKSEVGAMRVAREVLQTISMSPNAVQREKLVREAAQRLSLNPSALFEELRKVMRKASGSERSRGEEQVVSSSVPPDERDLCLYLVQSEDCPEVIDLVRGYLPVVLLRNALCRDVVAVVLETADSGGDLTQMVRDRDGSDGDMQAFIAGLIMGPSKTDRGEKSAADAVKDIILHFWRRELRDEQKALYSKQELNSLERERRRDITHWLKHLSKWDDALAIIDMEMESRSGAHS